MRYRGVVETRGVLQSCVSGCGSESAYFAGQFSCAVGRLATSGHIGERRCDVSVERFYSGFA